MLLHLPEMMRQQDNRNMMQPPTQILMGSTTNKSAPMHAGVRIRRKATEATAGLGSAMKAPRSWNFLCEKASLQGVERRLGQAGPDLDQAAEGLRAASGGRGWGRGMRGCGSTVGAGIGLKKVQGTTNSGAWG